MTERKYEKLIFTDMNRGKDEIGTLMFRLDKDVIENTPFFTAAHRALHRDDGGFRGRPSAGRVRGAGVHRADLPAVGVPDHAAGGDRIG